MFIGFINKTTWISFRNVYRLVFVVQHFVCLPLWILWMLIYTQYIDSIANSYSYLLFFLWRMNILPLRCVFSIRISHKNTKTVTHKIQCVLFANEFVRCGTWNITQFQLQIQNWIENMAKNGCLFDAPHSFHARE